MQFESHLRYSLPPLLAMALSCPSMVSSMGCKNSVVCEDTIPPWCLITQLFLLLISGIHTTYARQFSQASKWAAITCVVVNAPVIGKVAQVPPFLHFCNHCHFNCCQASLIVSSRD